MIILRQKEYTSVGRKIAAKWKRKRTDFANSMGRGLKKEADKRTNTAAHLSFEDKIVDPKLLKKSIREAKKYNARTMNSSIIEEIGSKCIKTDNLKEIAKRNNLSIDDAYGSKLGNAIKSNDNLIFLGGGDGYYDVTEHAHEVGHLKNNKLKNRNNVKFHKYLKSGGDKKRNLSLNTSKLLPILEKSGVKRNIKGKKIDTGTGFGEYIRRAVEGRNLVKEEENASKNALEFLKKSGASESVLSDSKSKFKKALDTYKSEAKIYRRMPLQNMLQIKSRRRK